MKVIQTDNFNRESVSDKLVCSDVENYWAERIAIALNKAFSSPDSSEFYAVVSDDYKLHAYDPT